MYNYNHLYYFYITVKTGGVTIASRRLSISQPSLSGQLKVLEEYLQIKLFIRIGRKNVLTSDGAIVFGYCRQMFELAEDMHEAITEKSTEITRRVYVGVSKEIANTFAVEIISHFLKKHKTEKRPKVIMVTDSDFSLGKKLEFRELDVLISTNAPSNNNVISLHHIDVPINLICSNRVAAIVESSSTDISTILKKINSIEKYKWVMPSHGFKLRREIDQYFETNNIKGKVVFESDVMESITRSIVDNVGIALLPQIYVPKELKHKSLFSFGPSQGLWSHKIWLSCYIKNEHNALTQSIMNSFIGVCDPLYNNELQE